MATRLVETDMTAALKFERVPVSTFVVNIAAEKYGYCLGEYCSEELTV